VVERDGREMMLPCHPADAVALAVRAGKPIMAHDSALAHARSSGTPSPEDAARSWLDQVRPADFADP
jgi:bifunctional DNase/RNase